jgi:hypothetical protein
MSDADNLNKQQLVVDRVHDSIVTNSNPIRVFRAGKLANTCRKWLVDECVDRGKDPDDDLLGQTLQLFAR